MSVDVRRAQDEMNDTAREFLEYFRDWDPEITPEKLRSAIQDVPGVYLQDTEDILYDAIACFITDKVKQRLGRGDIDVIIAPVRYSPDEDTVVLDVRVKVTLDKAREIVLSDNGYAIAHNGFIAENLYEFGRLLDDLIEKITGEIKSVLNSLERNITEDEALTYLRNHPDRWTTIQLYDYDNDFGYLVVPARLKKKAHELIDKYKDTDPEGYNVEDLIKFLERHKLPFLWIDAEGDETHYF